MIKSFLTRFSISIRIVLLLGVFAVQEARLLAQVSEQEPAQESIHWKSDFRFDYPKGEEVSIEELTAFLNQCFSNISQFLHFGGVPELVAIFDKDSFYNLWGYRYRSASNCPIFAGKADTWDYHYTVSDGHKNDIIDGISSVGIWCYFEEWRKSPSIGEMCSYLNARFSGDQETTDRIKNLSYLQKPVRTQGNYIYNFDKDSGCQKFFFPKVTVYPFVVAEELISSIQNAQQRGSSGSYRWSYEAPNGGWSSITIKYDQNGAYASDLGGDSSTSFYRAIWSPYFIMLEDPKNKE